MVAKFFIAAVAFISVCASAARLPPPVTKHALMARYIVNEAEWTSIATISANKDMKGYPFANLKSVADGAIGKGNGVPYIFLTPLDFTAIDVTEDSRATFMMTLAQGEYCKEKGYDPMDPRCARVIMTGRIKKIEENDPEHEVAKKAIFGRHEWLSHMPANHKFFFAKLDVESIVVLAFFGGPSYVKVDEYFGADQNAVKEYSNLYK